MATHDASQAETVQISHENETDDKQCEDYRKQRKSPVDGPYAWVLLLFCGIVFATQGGLTRSFSVIYEVLLERYGQSNTVTSMVPAVFGTMKMCSSPIVSVLIQRYGEGHVLLISSLLSTTGLIITALAPSIGYIIFGHGIVYAVSANGLIVCVLTCVNKYFNRKRGMANALLSSFLPLGGLALGPGLQFLFSYYGYFGAMLMVAAINFHSILTGCMVRPLVEPRVEIDSKVSAENSKVVNIESNHEEAEIFLEHSPHDHRKQRSDTVNSVVVHIEGYPIFEVKLDDITTDIQPCHPIHKVSENGFTNTPHGSKSKLSPKLTCRKLLKTLFDQLGLFLMQNKTFALFCFMMVAEVAAHEVIQSFLVPFALEKGFTDNQITWIFLVYNIFDIPSKLAAGYLFDIPVLRQYVTSMVAVCLVMKAVSLILFPLAMAISPAVGLASLAVIVTLRAAEQGQYGNNIAVIVGIQHFSAGLGLVRFCQGVGSLFAAPLAGFLKDKTGSYGMVYYVIGAILASSAGLFLTTETLSLCRSKSNDIIT